MPHYFRLDSTLRQNRAQDSLWHMIQNRQCHALALYASNVIEKNGYGHSRKRKRGEGKKSVKVISKGFLRKKGYMFLFFKNGYIFFSWSPENSWSKYYKKKIIYLNLCTFPQLWSLGVVKIEKYSFWCSSVKKIVKVLKLGVRHPVM